MQTTCKLKRASLQPKRHGCAKMANSMTSPVEIRCQLHGLPEVHPIPFNAHESKVELLVLNLSNKEAEQSPGSLVPCHLHLVGVTNKHTCA